MTMRDHRPYLWLWLFSILCTITVMVACGPPRPDDDGASADDDPPIPDLGSEDPWHCGELGLKCVGPLGFGECIDGQCQPILGHECTAPALTPTCDAYCEFVDSTCVPNRCAGATAWGWGGTLENAGIFCLDADQDMAIPLHVACDEPLEGLVTMMRCCCEY